MHSATTKRTAVAFALLAVCLFLQTQFGDAPELRLKSKVPVIGNVQNLRAAYAQWKVTNARTLGDGSITLPLRWSKGRSTEFTHAQGEATFDLMNGMISINAVGLSEQEIFDVWLVEYRADAPGNVTKSSVS